MWFSPTRPGFESRLGKYLLLFVLVSQTLSGHARPRPGWMAERSKALVLGTSLLGGVGSNPTPIILKLFCFKNFCLLSTVRECRKSRLAQLVERKTLNLVVVGSSPTVGGPLLWRSWQRVGLIILRSRVRSSPGALHFIFLFRETKK